MTISGAILVAEPHHAIAEMISETLRDEGYTVSIAHDCAGTITSIARQRPSLVLLDDHIATLDTADLDAHITQQYRVSIPIITTTTNELSLPCSMLAKSGRALKNHSRSIP